MVRNWKTINRSLVTRGELIMSWDIVDSWQEELDAMNKGKEGKQFVYPESFMQALAYARVYFGLPYRQTQGMIKSRAKHIPDVPDYSTINRRVNKLDIKINKKVQDDVIIAIDSTGIKVANRGEWMRQKWKKSPKRGFLKIHVASDVRTKKILSMKITDERSHDAQHLPSLIEHAEKQGNKITKVLADGAYDSKDNFSYLYYDKEILPAIKVRKTSSIHTDCYPRRKSVLAQLYNLDLWKLGVRYGDRWNVEGVFSSFKRFFSEHVMAHKYSNMAKELEIKASLYNLFVSV